jgi:hypothetical protein
MIAFMIHERYPNNYKEHMIPPTSPGNNAYKRHSHIRYPEHELPALDSPTPTAGAFSSRRILAPARIAPRHTPGCGGRQITNRCVVSHTRTRHDIRKCLGDLGSEWEGAGGMHTKDWNGRSCVCLKSETSTFFRRCTGLVGPAGWPETFCW